MPSPEPRLRGSTGVHSGPWPIGDVPDRVLLRIGEQLVHRLAIGQHDISGDDFANIFAHATDGEHRSNPLGIADIIAEDAAWSVKTVKAKDPERVSQVRLISGRNSPDYSLGISDPRSNERETGRAVLAIWNARVGAALKQYGDMRIAVCIRNMESRKFRVFEQPATQFPTDDFEWTFNKKGNLEGRDSATGDHFFTWQPHGSQFTIIRHVPGSARCFRIDQPVPALGAESVPDLIQFDQSWISID